MSLEILIILFIALVIIAIAGFVVIGGMRSHGQLQRALNMVLLLVKLPLDDRKREELKPKDLIGVFEQLLSGFSNIHGAGWNKFIYGEPYLAAEIAVHHLGEDIHFYIGVPRSSEQVIEKQIHGIFHDAEIERVDDYNIFNPDGHEAAAYAVYDQDNILPINTYQHLESDPLGGILNSMSKLKSEGEGAALQILFRPSHSGIGSFASRIAREMQSGYPYKVAYSRVKYPKQQSEEEKVKEAQKPKVITPADEEIIKALQNKAGKQLFDVNFRFIASADSEARAEQILNDSLASLAQFSSVNLNRLKPSKLKDRSLKKMVYNYCFRLFDRSNTVVMSSEELASLYHFPFDISVAPRIKYLKSKSAQLPANLPSEGVVMGINAYRGVQTPVRITDEDRRRHLYVIGQTGTGKTTLLKAMIRQDMENGKGLCVVDPHGDLADFALSVVPSERTDDVIYFNPGDIERPMGLNALEIDPKYPEQKTMVINELLSTIDKLYNLKETGGPMFEKYFKNALLLLLDDYQKEIPTLADISRVLVNDKYRADKLSRETNPLVSEFWKLEAEKAGGEASLANMAPYISSKVDTFVSNEFLRPIINQKKSAFNFRDVMDNKKILIVNLSKGRIGELNANLLGMLIVSKLLMSALSRVDIDEKDRNDFYLYIDEFQNFTTESIGTILSEARKYRLDLIIAHQFIKQLRDDIRDAVFGNVGSMAVFRIGADDAEFMKNKFEPVFTPHDLMSIDNLNAYLSLLVNGQTTKPFNIKIDTGMVFGAGSNETAAKIKEISRTKFGRPREEVEDEIRRSRIS